jgi:hypothetical protein
MKRFISQTLSFVLHPVFIPLWFAIVLINSGYFLNSFLNVNFYKSYLWLLIVIMIVLPTIVIIFSQQLGLIESIDSSISIDRIKILLITLLSSFFLYFFFKKIHIPLFYLLPIKISIILTILLVIFSTFMNVSIHSAGWMSLFSSLYVLQCRLIEIHILWIIVIIPILWGLACYARHLAGKHNSLQLITGAILGVLSGLSVLFM